MNPKIHLAPGAYLFLALLVLMLPLRWIAAALLAGVVHEGCHLLTIRLCGGEVQSIQIGIGGAVIQVGPLPRSRELLCALAGPLGGLLLLALARWLPRTAICAGFQSLYNLLPLYPLDGGRALACLADLLLPPQTARRFCCLAQWGSLAGLLLLGLYGTFCLRLGLLPIVVAVLLLRKYACKPGEQRVQ